MCATSGKLPSPSALGPDSVLTTKAEVPLAVLTKLGALDVQSRRLGRGQTNKTTQVCWMWELGTQSPSAGSGAWVFSCSVGYYSGTYLKQVLQLLLEGQTGDLFETLRLRHRISDWKLLGFYFQMAPVWGFYFSSTH